jgi:hypothetical protein
VKVTLEFNNTAEMVSYFSAPSNVPATPVESFVPAEQPTKRRGRPPKSTVTEAAIDAPAPAVVEEDPFSLDEPKPEPVKAEPAKPVTKEDVRAALVSYQTAVKEKLLKTGKSEDEAKTEAMATARALLNKVGGTDKLGGLDEGKNAAVVTAAREAAAKL